MVFKSRATKWGRGKFITHPPSPPNISQIELWDVGTSQI